MTPYEALTGRKPDLSNLHPWGTRVWVHTTGGSKLDGRAKEGRWVGFDEESKGHRIYWEGKRTVTVERSVRFVPETRDVHEEAEDVTLEGEIEGERPAVPISTTTSAPTSPQPSLRATVEDVVEDDDDDDVVPAAEPVEESGRPTRVHKESDYVRRLRSGEGTAKRSFRAQAQFHAACSLSTMLSKKRRCRLFRTIGRWSQWRILQWRR